MNDKELLDILKSCDMKEYVEFSIKTLTERQKEAFDAVQKYKDEIEKIAVDLPNLTSDEMKKGAMTLSNQFTAQKSMTLMKIKCVRQELKHLMDISRVLRKGKE